MASLGDCSDSYKQKVFTSFLNGRCKLLSGLALHRILEQLTETTGKHSIATMEFLNPNPTSVQACFLCWEKEKLFRELWMDCGTSVKQADCENDKLTSKPALVASDAANPVLSVDEVWKFVKSADDKQLNDVTSKQLILPECVKRSGTDAHGKELSEKDNEDWKALYISVAEDLLKYSEESVEECSQLINNDTKYCTFAVKTKLCADELHEIPTRVFKMHNMSTEDGRHLVTINVCHQCLQKICYDVHKCDGHRTDITHCILDLVNHIVATMYVAASEFTDTNTVMDETVSRDANDYKSPDHLTITVVCEDKDAIRLPGVACNESASSITKSGCNIGPPVTISMPNNTVSSTNTSTVAASDASLKVERKLCTVQVTKNVHDLKRNGLTSVLKQGNKPLKHVGTTAGKKSRCGVPVTHGKTNLHLQTDSLCGTLSDATCPSSNVLPISSVVTRSGTSKVDLQQSKVIQKFSVTTLNQFGGNGTQNNKYVIKMICPKSDQNQLCSSTMPTGMLQKIPFSPVINEAMLKKIKQEPNEGVALIRNNSLLNQTKFVKLKLGINPVVLPTSTLRLVKRENCAIPLQPTISPSNGENCQTGSLKSDNHVEKQNKMIDLIVSTYGKDLPSTSGGKPGRPKTPSKRRNKDGKDGSMKSAVYSYLTSSIGDKESEIQSNKQQSGRRQISSNKIIPIPYESHYLCICDTLAKKGWKAYWFRKCRCARSARSKRRYFKKAKTVTATSKNIKSEVSKTEITCKSTCDIPMPITMNNCTSDVSSDISSKLLSTDDVSMTDKQLHVPQEPILSHMNEQNCSVSPSKSNSTVDITDTECLLKEKWEMKEDCSKSHHGENSAVEPKMQTSNSPVKLVSRKEMNARQKKVESVLDATMKEKNLTVDNRGGCKEAFNSLTCPYIFAQFHEQVEKQPSSLDIVSSHSFWLKEFKALSEVAEELEKKRNSRKETLLKPASTCNSPSKHTNNDLHFVWPHGKQTSFFNMKKPAQPLRRQLVLKRNLRKIKRRAYRHHATAPKHKLLYIPKKVSDDDDVPSMFDVKPYKPAWNIPGRSISNVVGKLENLWGEDDERFMGLKAAQAYGAIDISREQIDHALSALKHNNEIVTFSSKRVKKKKGKNPVLLISRKFVNTPSMPHLSTDDYVDAPCQDHSHASPNLKINHKCNLVSNEMDKHQSKILLKLRKTGEVSGSAIYRVPTPSDSQSNCTNSGGEYDIDAARPCSSTSDVIHTGNPTTQNNDETCSFEEKQNQVDKIEESQQTTDSSYTQEAELISREVDGSVEKNLSPKNNSCSIVAEVEEAQQMNSTDKMLREVDPNMHENITDILSSTLIDYSEQDDMFSSGSQLFTFCHHDQHDKYKNSFYSKEGDDYKIIDWDKDVLGTDSLEEMLLAVTNESLEALERILIFKRKANITASDITCNRNIKPPTISGASPIMNANTDQNYKKCGSCSPSTSFIDATHLCIASTNDVFSCTDELLDVKPTSLTSSFISMLDSPEIVRGMSNSKQSGKTNNQAISIPPISPTVSDEEFEGSPQHSSILRLNAGSPYNRFSPVLKSCNVLLRPIEGMMDSFRSNGGSSVDGKASPSVHSIQSDVSLTETSAKELNKLYKNHSLNGSYWKSVEMHGDGCDMASTSNGHWHLRGRTKRKSSEEVSIESDVEVESVDIERNKSPEKIETDEFGSKRKRFGNIKHSHLSNDAIADVAKHIWKDSIINNQHKHGKINNAAKTSEVFNSLFKTELNTHEVCGWLLSATASQPLPLQSNILLYRKSVAYKASNRRFRRHSSEISTSSVVTSGTDGVNGQKARASRKHAKGESSPQRRHRLDDADEFEDLRRQLFRIRHPNYAGDLCDDAPVKLPHNVVAPPSGCTRLLRVNEHEARKDDSPSLTTSVIVGQNPFRVPKRQRGLVRGSDNEFELPKKRMKMSSRLSKELFNANALMATVDSSSPGKSRRRSTTKLHGCHDFPPPRNHTKNISHKCDDSTNDESDLSTSLSSRGRSIKPSLRGRAIKMSMAKKNELSSIPPGKNIARGKIVGRPGIDEAGPARGRFRGRFVNKHSTAGSYIKQILQSGAYDG